MSGELKIDVDACYEGAEKLRERASEPDAAASTLQGEVDAAVEGLDPMGFDSKGALAAALAAWKRRIHGHRLLFDDLAEFIETNTALAEQHDAESESDLVALGSELELEAGEYTATDYHEVTGAADIRTGEDGAVPTIGGEDVAV
jgi:hypothetical protein